MDGDVRQGGLEDLVVLTTEVVLARTRLSPRAMEEGRRAGTMEFRGAEDGRVQLEAGGVVIGEGRIIRKGGRAFFKVLQLMDAEEKAGMV
ncbi:MAG: hypothetical protein WCQ50_10395 [Spirochaetota bacterium]